MINPLTELRIDKWLKTSRFFKQRTAATEAVEAGMVKVNEERVKPSKNIKAGDILTIRLGTRYRKFRVEALYDKSVSKETARTMYCALDTDNTRIDSPMAEYIDIIEKQDEENRKNSHRPDKKERRALSKMKYGSDGQDGQF